MSSPFNLTLLPATVADKTLRAVHHAVAQQALEGLTVSDATVNDMRRASLGEIPDEEVIANIYARFSATAMAKSNSSHVPILRP